MCIAKKMIVLTIGLAASSHHAQAAPMFTLAPITSSLVTLASEVSNSETLVDTVTPGTLVAIKESNVVTKSKSTYTTVITKAPTATTSGSATTYEKYRQTTTHTNASYNDTSTYKVAGLTAATSKSDFQYIRLIGSITAHVNTEFTYQLIANGTLKTLNSKNHPGATPPMAAMWFSSGNTMEFVSNSANDVELFGSRNPDANYKQLSNISSTPISMKAGDTMYIAAQIDSVTNVNMSDFYINFISGIYGGEKSAPTSTDVSEVLFISEISPIPEPGTGAMFLASLALMGVMIRRKKTPS